MEELDEEDLEESESVMDQAEEEEELEESESEEELLSDVEESEDEDSEEEDDGSGDGNLTSNSENSEPNTSSVPSDCIIHFGTQMSLFKPSERFFCNNDLTSPSMAELDEVDLEESESEEE